MSPLQALETAIIKAYPFVELRVREYLDPAARQALDIRVGARLFVVEWSAATAFWVSEVRTGSVLDEAPDVCVGTADEALDAVRSLIELAVGAPRAATR
jgi:hypothetical protein